MSLTERIVRASGAGVGAGVFVLVVAMTFDIPPHPAMPFLAALTAVSVAISSFILEKRS